MKHADRKRYDVTNATKNVTSLWEYDEARRRVEPIIPSQTEEADMSDRPSDEYLALDTPDHTRWLIYRIIDLEAERDELRAGLKLETKRADMAEAGFINYNRTAPWMK